MIMSDQGETYNVEFERRGKEISARTYKELVSLILREFAITDDVVLEAVKTDGSECEIFGDRLLEDNRTSKIVVYHNPPNPCAIQFGEREYRLDIIPESDTILVKIAKEVIIPEFNVPNFVGNLTTFVNCVRLTHFHLLASGNRKLAMALHRLGRKGLKPLSDKCTATLDLFVSTSRDVLVTFETVFAHCLDHLEEQAVTNLECLGKKASTMKNKAAEIIKDIEEQKDKTEKLLEGTGKKWATEGLNVDKKGAEIEQTKEKLSEVRELEASAESIIELSLTAHKDYTTLNKELNFLKRFAWNVRYVFNTTPSEGSEYYDWVDSWNRKVQAEESAKEARSNLTKVTAKKNKHEKTLERTEKERNALAKQGEYLGKALQAIKNAHLTMQAMYMFWSKMEQAIEQLIDNQPFIECLRKANDRIITKLLRSRAFKRQGITYMARCVAIRDISISCGKGMSTVNKDMEDFLREQPDQEEAKKLLENKDFVKKLGASLSVIPSTRPANRTAAQTREETEIRGSFQQPSGKWLQFELVSNESLGDTDVL